MSTVQLHGSVALYEALQVSVHAFHVGAGHVTPAEQPIKVVPIKVSDLINSI